MTCEQVFPEDLAQRLRELVSKYTSTGADVLEFAMV